MGKAPLFLVFEPFNASLGCFFELLLLKAERGKPAVGWQLRVEISDYLQEKGVPFIFSDAVFFEGIPVRDDQRDNLAFFFDGERLLHEGRGIDTLLNLFRVDILPRGTENHVLVPPPYKDKIVLVQRSQVARL